MRGLLTQLEVLIKPISAKSCALRKQLLKETLLGAGLANGPSH